jgi:hypothetical protein
VRVAAERSGPPPSARGGRPRPAAGARHRSGAPAAPVLPPGGRAELEGTGAGRWPFRLEREDLEGGTTKVVARERCRIRCKRASSAAHRRLGRGLSISLVSSSLAPAPGTPALQRRVKTSLPATKVFQKTFAAMAMLREGAGAQPGIARQRRLRPLSRVRGAPALRPTHPRARWRRFPNH